MAPQRHDVNQAKGYLMQQADVIFFQSGESVEVMLFMDGNNILNSHSMESVVRELQIRQVSRLGIEQLFCAELPTSKADLARAEHVAFSEPMTAMKLIAACASLGAASSYFNPERRAVPRPEASPQIATMH